MHLILFCPNRVFCQHIHAELITPSLSYDGDFLKHRAAITIAFPVQLLPHSSMSTSCVDIEIHSRITWSENVHLLLRKCPMETNNDCVILHSHLQCLWMGHLSHSLVIIQYLSYWVPWFHDTVCCIKDFLNIAVLSHNLGIAFFISQQNY